MAELNVANRTLFHGDNLDFLRGMNSGSVNLIATEFPFGSRGCSDSDSLAKTPKTNETFSLTMLLRTC